MKFRNGVCTSNARLDGKTVLITGANSGIGRATAQDMYRRGAHVLLACRNREKAYKAIKEIKMTTYEYVVGDMEFVELDLSSFASISKCVEHVNKTEKHLHILINNAGVLCCPQSKTRDGFETQFGVNHLGHFLLTILLLPKLIESGPARIVNVSSTFHTQATLNLDDLCYEKRRYSALGAYMQSKLCNILFTKELARRLKEAKVQGVNVYAVHPGIICTELIDDLDSTYVYGSTLLWRILTTIFGKTVTQGAQTTIYCAVEEKLNSETGLYYSDCDVETPASSAQNMEDAKKLWDLSIKYCKMEKYDPFLIN